MDLEIEMIENTRAEFEEHARTCDKTPKAILLHPGNHELLGWDEMFGLPVLPDDRVEPMRARLLCGQNGWGGRFEGRRVWWSPEGDPFLEADDFARVD